MKLLRVGEKGKEKPALLDGDGKKTIMTQDEALKKPDGTYRVHSIKVKRSHNISQAKIDFS